MLLPPIYTVEFLGHDLLFMEASWAAATAVLGAVMVFASMPQPTPQWGGSEIRSYRR